MKNLIKKLKIILICLVILPLIPYKCVVFEDKSDIKIKASQSSQFGLVADEDYSEFGVYKGMELENFLEKESYKKLVGDTTVFIDGLSGRKFNLYGEFIEDTNGKKKFCIKKWSSLDVRIYHTYVWKDKLGYIDITIIFIIIFMLLYLKKQSKIE